MSVVDRAAEMLADAVLAATPDHELGALMNKVDRLNAALDARQPQTAPVASLDAARDRGTVSTVCGVRVNPGLPVHAFRAWTGPTALMTWCAIQADTTVDAVPTTDLITCRACKRASQAAWFAP